MEIINYGLTKNYLKHWGVNEALREIMQNFLDYGTYKITKEKDKGVVEISSDWLPLDLTFLGIGNSEKPSTGARGKYGEGLKMAMLVLRREGYSINIITNNTLIMPFFQKTVIGETLAIKIMPKERTENFIVRIRLESIKQWEDFYNDIIKPEDVIYDDCYYGRIVRRKKGRIYCGGLFVAEVDNIKKAYDINPAHLSLDRDRSVPREFDVNWAASKINEKQGKLTVKDLSYDDTKFVDSIPEKIKKQITPKLVGNTIVATYIDKKTNKEEVIKNSKVQELVRKDSFFSVVINRLRNFILDKLGVYQMLVEFRDKHLFGEQKDEFNLILEKFKNKYGDKD
jgi:hypothetical protein